MGSSYGTLTLTNIQELKYLWENSQGTHMASGISGVPFDINNPNTYGYNSLYGVGELQFRYNAIPLNIIDANGMRIYKSDDSINPVANFGSSIQLGKSAENHIYITPELFSSIASSGEVLFSTGLSDATMLKAQAGPTDSYSISIDEEKGSKAIIYPLIDEQYFEDSNKFTIRVTHLQSDFYIDKTLTFNYGETSTQYIGYWEEESEEEPYVQVDYDGNNIITFTDIDLFNVSYPYTIRISKFTYYITVPAPAFTFGSRQLQSTIGGYSASFGQSAASGNYSVSEGQGVAKGDYSHAEGRGTAEGDYSHAEGRSYAKGAYSHAEGRVTDTRYEGAFGDYSHIEGYNNTAIGNYSHVEGQANTVKGNYSHVGGANNNEEGVESYEGIGYNYVNGYFNTVSGTNIFCTGDVNEIYGVQITALGSYLKTDYVDWSTIDPENTNEDEIPAYQTIIGRGNKPDNNALFIIGNGVNTERNVFVVDKQGNLNIPDDFKIVNQDQTNSYLQLSSVSQEGNPSMDIYVDKLVDYDSETGEETHIPVKVASFGQTVYVGQGDSTRTVINSDSMQWYANDTSLAGGVTFGETSKTHVVHESGEFVGNSWGWWTMPSRFERTENHVINLSITGELTKNDPDPSNLGTYSIDVTFENAELERHPYYRSTSIHDVPAGTTQIELNRDLDIADVIEVYVGTTSVGFTYSDYIVTLDEPLETEADYIIIRYELPDEYSYYYTTEVIETTLSSGYVQPFYVTFTKTAVYCGFRQYIPGGLYSQNNMYEYNYNATMTDGFDILGEKVFFGEPKSDDVIYAQSTNVFNQLRVGHYTTQDALNERAIIVGRGTRSATDSAFSVSYDGNVYMYLEPHAQSWEVDNELYKSLIKLGWTDAIIE